MKNLKIGKDIQIKEKNNSALIRIKLAVKETAENSTSHGIPNIARTDSNILKLMWLICLLGSAGGCAYLVFDSLNGYLNYEVVTKISKISETPSPFPIISICVSIFY